MSNAVIYARYSSSHQREESIEGQIRECEAFAKRNNYTVIKHYIDRAMSARTDARPQFQQMIADSAKGAFDYVIVYQLDRFSRNRYDSAINKAKLKKNGVKLLSAKENITSDPAGIILESVLEGIAEYYSAELSQKVKRGMTDNALSGRWCSGRVPLGYTLNAEKRLIIDPVKAPVVNEIFHRYANNQKLSEIADWLNSINFKTATGGKFGRSSFHRMLSNKVYIGTMSWNGIVCENACEPIVTKSIFDACQLRNAENKKEFDSMPRRSSKYMLTTKIKCACCNGPMVGISGKNHLGNTYYYYACQNTRNKRTKCSTGYINRDQIENAVIDKATAILSRPENINLIAEQAIKYNAKTSNHLEILELEYKNLKNKIANTIKAIEKGAISDTMINNLNMYEAELQQLENDIAKEKLIDDKIILTKQHIAFFLTRFKTMPSPQARAYILNVLLDQVIVEKIKDGNWLVTVSYNFYDDPNLSNTEKFSIHEDSEQVRNYSPWWR